jgi:hypothetical protein
MSRRCAIYVLTIDTRRAPGPTPGEPQTVALTVAVEPFQVLSTSSVAFRRRVAAVWNDLLGLNVIVEVWFPRIVAWLESSTRVPERPWSRTRHGAEPWHRSTTSSTLPVVETLVMVTGEVLKRTMVPALFPPALLATTRK